MHVPTNTICYLEIVTPDVDAACRVYTASYGWAFGEPVPELGGGRIANLVDGSVCAVRGPLRPDEGPVTRAYVRVANLAAAVDAAEAAGALVALRSMEIPGRGQIAIVFNGGIEQGFWQVE